jgi:hypothetical protein
MSVAAPRAAPFQDPAITASGKASSHTMMSRRSMAGSGDWAWHSFGTDIRACSRPVPGFCTVLADFLLSFQWRVS